MSFYYSIFLLLFFYSFNILFNIEIMKTLYYILYYSFINFNYLFTFNFIFKYLNHLKIIHFLVLKKTNFTIQKTWRNLLQNLENKYIEK